MTRKYIYIVISYAFFIATVLFFTNQNANAMQTCGCSDPRPFSCDGNTPCQKVGNCRNDYCTGNPGGCAGCGGGCSLSSECSSNQTRWYDCEPLDTCGKCSCPACTDTSPTPSPFSLISPLNCTVVNPSGASVALSWNAITDWGKNCGTQSNSYKVYVDSVNNPPAAASLSGSVAAGTTSYAYNNWARGQRYYWRVEATNGTLSSWSNVGCFDITPAPRANLTVAPATASDTLILNGTAAGTGGNLYSSVVGDSLKMTLNGSQANSFLSSVTLYDRQININPVGAWSVGGLFTAPCSGVSPCASISNNTYNWTVKSGTWQLVVNAFNNNNGYGGRCTGNPDPASFPFTASGVTWYDCSNTADGQRDIITVNAIPARTVSGSLYSQEDINICATDNLTDSDNSATVTLKYDFAGVSNRSKSYNVTFPNPAYTFSIPDGAVLRSLCVTNLVPVNGDYTIACVNGNTNPTGTLCYSYPGLGTTVNGSNINTPLSFFKHTQTAWYTLIDSDIYSYNAINQSIPAGVAPFSGVLVDHASSDQKSYAFSSDSNISSGDGTNNIYVTNHGGFATGLGTVSNFYYLTDDVSGSDLNSFPTLSLSDLEGIDTSTHKLFKSSDATVGTTTYDVSYDDSLPGDTAVVYVTPGSGEGTLSFTGNFQPGSVANSGRLLFYVIGTGIEFGPKAQIIGQPLLAVNNFGDVTNDVEAGFITNGMITVQGSGSLSTSDDNTLVVKGILAGNNIRIKRTRGFINNEIRPAFVSRYDTKYLYDLTKDLREDSVSQIPGLSMVDITWSEN